MNKTHTTHILRSCLSILLAAVMLFSMVPAVFATEATAGSTVQNGNIQLLDGLKFDYSDYLNSEVAFRLPDGIADDEEISVIIRHDVPSLMDAYDKTDKTMSLREYAATEEAADVLKDIDARRDAILATLDEQGVEYKLGEQYNTLFSGFELLIKGGDYTVTCMSMADGEKVVLGNEYKPQEAQLVENDVNVYETGIFNASGVPYDGTGMVVAVLDTGLDSNHSAFSTDNFTSDQLGLTYDDVAKLVGKTKAYEWAKGLSADDVFINNKVPFGYDYADNDPDVYSTHNNHGTHVSGVIVGKDDTITGVAPNAQLVSMKIFSDVEDSAMSSWILAALEDCVILGVDVINMSLGTACGFGHETEEELLDGVYDRLRKAGIAVVVAASNSYNSAYGSEANGNLPLTSNPDSGTVGSPGTYAGTLSVASVNGVETPYIKYGDSIIYFDEANDNSGKEKKFFETLLGDNQSQEIEYVTVPGVGRSADYTGLDVKGKIALVRRGSNTFEEKALIAEAQGAVGIIIYNNVSGEIKMNIGDATLAVCSIAQDDGEVLAAAGTGVLKIDKSQTSGPFMSDFSSWGPTPSLGIKPEITAHGGNILSSVTGGGYDRLSGTSMACPNTAGAVVLMHQYVCENFPEIADDAGAVTALVNRLMMSTADILINTNGQPYAVRKQGAGLANLDSATKTPAAIITYDKDGNPMDTTKLELGDDPDKNGVYEMTFAVDNFSKKTLTYNVSASVITEGVSETKTNAGETTVTEQAYVLEGAKMEIISVEGGSKVGNNVVVKKNSQATVKVRITLSDEDKQYLNESFENGMYVEGFISLDAVLGTKIDLSVPYLAFYGDWTQAPMFDLEYYDTNADELDKGIDPEDKLMADAFPSRAVGGISSDFVSYLGTYYFVQDPDDVVIAANKDYIALSNQSGSICSLRFVWAGMLRAASSIDITITNDATGEVVFETVEKDIRKSYGDGGTIRPSNIEIEFDVKEHNLPNNAKLTVKLVGHMDYGDGGEKANRNRTMEFPLTIDFEAPTISDVEYYYEYDKTAKKNKLFAKVAVYDNHYAMCGQLGYVKLTADADGNEAPELFAFEQYMTPIYSKENSTTYVTIDLTDYVYTIKDDSFNKNSFVFTTYDYALNYASYEIRLPDTFKKFTFEGLEEGLTMSPNEVFTLAPIVEPSTSWSELLEFKSSKPSVVRVVNNKLVAANSGRAIIRVSDPTSGLKYTFPVTVLKEGDEGYRKYDKPVADMFILSGYTTQKAYYMLDNEDKDIGDAGNVRFFEGNYNLSMYPSESVVLNCDLDTFYPRDTQVLFESSNEDIVKVTSSGQVTAVAEGFASVTIKIQQDGKSTYYSESVSVEVKDPYDAANGILNHYYGLGGLVEVPERLRLKEIGNFAFANFEYIDKTPEELERDDRETTKQWFIGDGTITKVVLPEGIEKINAYAFANLTALEEVVLPSTLTAIEYGAFYNCTSLKKITFSGENKVQIINQHAFEKCDLEGTLEMPSACVISDYAFAGNKKLEKVVTGESLLSIGQYAFAGCEGIKEVTVKAKLVKYGTYAFTGCESLEKFDVNAVVLPEGMFYECESLTEVTIGPDVNTIEEFAFRDTDVKTFNVKSGSKAFKSGKKDYIVSKNGKTIVAVAPTVKGKVDAETFGGGKITEVAKGAFSHTKKVTTVNLPEVTKVGDYGFGSASGIKKVTLGELKEVGEYAFFETAISTLPAFTAKTDIGKYAFAFTAIKKVTIPDKMKVAEGVFSECSKLTTVVVGNNVTLGKYAFGTDKDNAFSVKHKNENGKRYFYYTFGTALKNVTIGENADIGETAFTNAASLKKVTLGKGAKLGKMAFYNCASLEDIDLSAVTEFGEYAMSGDVYYMCLDDQMSVAAVDSTGHYMYTYHAPAIKEADLSSAKSVDQYAFAYCRDMTTVKLGDKITEIKPYTFAGCSTLKNINTAAIKTVGEYAFTECGALAKVDLTAAKEIGEYAFVYNRKLKTVTLNPKGAKIDEAAFSYCDVLKTVENLDKVTDIGNYGFAYSAVNEVVLTDLEKLGDHVFIKEKYTPFKVTLGEELETIGDNPFAMCIIAPFTSEKEEKVNGVKQTVTTDTFDINKNVTVHGGSLYTKVPEGWKLITYLGQDPLKATVMEDTVRVSAMAFIGSDVKLVDLPATVAAIGHKAFFDCDKLEMVVFKSYRAPVLEEAFDPTYYESFTHVPGTGDYGTYDDYDGNEVAITGEGILPYFMWNATGGMYSNVFYGANFKDYVGYVKNKVAMIRPTNGVNYDSYIYDQYFALRLDGTIAAEDAAVAAIKAIKKIPAKVTDAHRAVIKAARTAYDKVPTTLQQGLVYNYSDLVTAEQRLAALDDAGSKPEADEQPVEEKASTAWIWWTLLGLIIAAALIGLCVLAYRMKYEGVTKDDVRAAIKSIPGKFVAGCKAFPAAFVKFCKAFGIGFIAFFKAFPGKFVGFFKNLPRNFIKFCKAFPAGFVRFCKGFPGWCVKAAKAIAAAAVKAALAVAALAVYVWIDLKNAAIWAWPYIKKAALWVWAQLKKLYALCLPVLVPVGNFIAKIWGIVAAFFVKVFTPIGRFLGKIFRPVGRFFAVVFGAIGRFFDKVFGAIGRFFRKLFPKKEKKEKPAKEPKPAKVKEPKPRKERKPLPAWTKWVLMGVAALAAIGLLVWMFLTVDFGGVKTPYEINDEANYTVSVKFDANGGIFTTNTSVMVDSYNVKDMPVGADGKVSLALLAPDNEQYRGKGNAFAATKTGCMLAGWYTQRTETGTDAEGNPTYSYSGLWDFATGRHAVDPNGTYTSAEPVLTLYAVWVPKFEVQFYDRANPDTLLGSHECSSLGETLTLPAWNKETGAMDMNDVPARNGYTIDKLYLDVEGKQPIEGETLTHTGTLNTETGTAEGAVMKVYTDWTEGEWYHIYNAEQFVKNASVNGCYILHDDLDFTDKYWPDSLMTGNFAGQIQGNGHVIRNVNIEQRNSAKTNVGLFGTLTEKAAISDVTFENVTFTIKKGAMKMGSSFGILCGTLSDKATIKDVVLKDSSLLIDSGCYFGTDDYAIGLVCGIGKSEVVKAEDVQCSATGDKPSRVKIKVDGDTVTLEFVD
ncbi:MAG: leucine-rich repeat protein [Clostridia bacterium]|nr:leucine-rich repeat protein [Clostridia bacterium]